MLILPDTLGVQFQNFSPVVHLFPESIDYGKLASILFVGYLIVNMLNAVIPAHIIVHTFLKQIRLQPFENISCNPSQITRY